MDEVIELDVPAFLMPPIDLRHRERMSEFALFQMEGTVKRLWFPKRTIRVRAVRNVFVAEEGLAIHPDLALEPWSVRAHSPAQIERARSAVTAAVQAGGAAHVVPRLEGDVVLGKTPGSGNYGHWLVEMLPMAYVAAQHWPRPARFLVPAAQEPLASVMDEAYARLGIPAASRIPVGRELVFAERLIIVEGLSEHGTYVSPLVMECLDRIAASIPAGREARIFISRGQAATRRLPGEAALMTRLGAAGYAGFAPGGASFAAQVSAFKGARRIVGVMGATLTSLAFAAKGAEVIVLSPANMPDTFFWFLCGLRGVRFVDVRCRSLPSEIGNSEWDGAFDLDQADEDEIVALAKAEPDAEAFANLELVPKLFDPAFYRAAAGAGLPEGADPLAHYMTEGWRRDLDPSPYFSTRGYLNEYPDLEEIGIHPLMHFIEHGMGEGRLPLGRPRRKRAR